MKRPKEYEIRVIERPNGDIEVRWVLEQMKINQHKRRWVASDKRRFGKKLKGAKLIFKKIG